MLALVCPSGVKDTMVLGGYVYSGPLIWGEEGHWVVPWAQQSPRSWKACCSAGPSKGSEEATSTHSKEESPLHSSPRTRMGTEGCVCRGWLIFLLAPGCQCSRLDSLACSSLCAPSFTAHRHFHMVHLVIISLYCHLLNLSDGFLMIRIFGEEFYIGNIVYIP